MTSDDTSPTLTEIIARHGNTIAALEAIHRKAPDDHKPTIDQLAANETLNFLIAYHTHHLRYDREAVPETSGIPAIGDDSAHLLSIKELRTEQTYNALKSLTDTYGPGPDCVAWFRWHEIYGELRKCVTDLPNPDDVKRHLQYLVKRNRVEQRFGGAPHREAYAIKT